MSEGIEFRGVEERLRAAGAPATPPAGYADIARAAALGDLPGEAPRRRVFGLPRRGGFSVFRAAMAVAVIAGSVAVAMLIGVGGRGPPPVAASVSRSGTGGATASVDIPEPDGPFRDGIVRIEGLEPAP